MKSKISILVFTFVCLITLRAQTGQNPISVNVRDKGSNESPLRYLNGYRREIEGSTITYHSVHPDAEDALIARVNAEAPSITWETDTMTADFPGNAYRFVWLAGMDRIGWGNATTPHTFHMLLNGTQIFIFHNRKDSTAPHWTITGANGEELTFDARMRDKYGDLFGYMFLSVPKDKYPAGAPLKIRVDGMNEGSPEWYMAFKYSFNFVPSLRVEPALVRNQNAESHLLRMSLDNLRPGRRVEVKVGDSIIVSDSLKLGANIYLLPFVSATGQKNVTVNYSVNGNKTDSRTMEITPVKQRSIYFIPHTHNDIGYTDLQPDVRAKQWHHLDQALELIKKTKDYPEDSRYKWNLEILWSLESWLQNASPEKKEEFIADVRAGSIGMNALLVNPLTGLANATEMSHFTEFARKFSEQYGIPITTAAVSDVPGFTWGMVPMLAQSGVKYFASGPNTGDRIGYVIDDWGDKPFYWDSQSGSERVLFWVAGSGYSSFHQATLANGGPERVMKIIRKLDATNYPYDIYYMPYTLGDNGGNDTTLSDFVRQWNERYISPRLVIATHKQLFTDFIKEYGDSLPVHKGDFTPYWEDGAVSTANETALDRAAVDRLTQGEALWSMRAPERFPDSVAYAAWRNVTLWDEHTWGADISVSDPDSAKTTGQWKIKRQYALDADSLSKALVASAVHQDKSESSTFDIVNTSSWPRTDVVMLTKGQSAAGDHASDMNEKPLRAQRLSTGELAVFVNDIPPMGAKRIRISKGKSARSARLKMINNTLTFGKATIAIDPNNGGIRKLRWKETPDSSMTAQGIKGIPRKNATHESEFVDTTRGQGVNEFLYVPGINSDSTLIVRNVKVAFIEQGDLLVRIRVTADAPGCNSYSYTVTLYSKIDRIDLETNIDKKAIREKEGAHIAFPFNIPGGKLRYDVAAGIITPEDDQLTGACKNFFSVASWADVSNDSMGVTVATLDAPLIEMGAINAERPWMKSIAQSATFYSYVLNNYWHTNYKADQSGPIRFAYSLWPHKQYASEDAARFGAERRAPLIVAPVNDGEPVVTSLCTVTPSAIEVSSIKPIEAGKSLLVFLYNPSNANQTVGIVWKDETNLMMYRSDAFGHKESGPIGNMRIRPYGTEYLLAEWK